MSKKINELQSFFIDHNPGLSDTEISRITGLTTRQISYYRRKDKSRVNGVEKGEEESVTPTPNVPVVPRITLDKLMAKRGGATSMTAAASELADDLDGISPKNGEFPAVKVHDPFSDTTKVHRIK